MRTMTRRTSSTFIFVFLIDGCHERVLNFWGEGDIEANQDSRACLRQTQFSESAQDWRQKGKSNARPSCQSDLIFFLFMNVFSVFLFFCIFRPFLYVMRVCKRLAPGREVQWPMWSCQPVSICICVYVFCICIFIFCTSVLRTSRGLAPEREVQWPVKLSICRYLFHRRLNIATTAPKLTSPQIKLD